MRRKGSSLRSNGIIDTTILVILISILPKQTVSEDKTN
jgi:hypothetical protein